MGLLEPDAQQLRYLFNPETCSEGPKPPRQGPRLPVRPFPMSLFIKSLAGSQGNFGKCMGQAKLYKPVFLPELKEARLFSNAEADTGDGRGKRAILGGLAHLQSPQQQSREG